MTITPRRRLIRRRLHNLPSVHRCEIWIRQGGRLICKVCGKP